MNRRIGRAASRFPTRPTTSTPSNPPPSDALREFLAEISLPADV
jgi:hypothetical protein